MLRQPIHFAPGAIPIWLPRSVITDHGAGGMRPVSVVIARETANRFRKDYRRCHEWNRASYNRDRHFDRPIRGNAA